MTQIIDNLYLSSVLIAKDINILRNNNIKCIVNCTKDQPNFFENELKYKRVEIIDDYKENILQYFDSTCKFINENIKNKVLVHCNAGQSRSASIVIAYLMKYENMTLTKALEYVKNKKSDIGPNIGFFKQLIEYENNLFETNTITYQEYTEKYIKNVFPDISDNILKKILIDVKYDPMNAMNHILNNYI